jgi:hypothetical protein
VGEEKMNHSQKALAISLSVIIIVFCVGYALIRWGGFTVANTGVDQTQSEKLTAGDSLTIDSRVCGVTVTQDAAATGVSAHLYGSYVGLGSVPELTVYRSGNAVTVRAGRESFTGFNLSFSLKLDVVVPMGFSGDFTCTSSAGAVTVDADLAVNSFEAHSSAGAVRVKNVKAGGAVDIDSSAGSVDAGTITASTADLHSSAGGVHVDSCTAGKIRLQSSAGGVSADALSGEVDASSSAGSVDITMADVKGDVNASSSAGRVSLKLPAGANADIDASTSAGSVSVGNLDLSITTQKRDHVAGKLGTGGPQVTVHSSAGSVEVTSK